MRRRGSPISGVPAIEVLKLRACRGRAAMLIVPNECTRAPCIAANCRPVRIGVGLQRLRRRRRASKLDMRRCSAARRTRGGDRPPSRLCSRHASPAPAASAFARFCHPERPGTSEAAPAPRAAPRDPPTAARSPPAATLPRARFSPRGRASPPTCRPRAAHSSYATPRAPTRSLRGRAARRAAPPPHAPPRASAAAAPSARRASATWAAS